MKIENGVLVYDDGNKIADCANGILEIDADCTCFYRDECRQLAHYLLRFAETGELKEPEYCGLHDSNNCAKCYADGVESVVCSSPTPKNEPTDEQQLAREKLAFWEKSFCSVAMIHHYTSGDCSDFADKACLKWLKARERYGVK